MENAELIKALKAEANCKQFYGQHNDCYGCPMPHKDNPSYQRMCVDFAEEVLPQLADALEAADRRIAELKAAQRWISVKERLPAVTEYRNGDKFKSMDSNELVPFLVCCEDTEIPFRAFYDGKNWGDGWGKQNVTHWQHLPQLPEKG